MCAGPFVATASTFHCQSAEPAAAAGEVPRLTLSGVDLEYLRNTLLKYFEGYLRRLQPMSFAILVTRWNGRLLTPDFELLESTTSDYGPKWGHATVSLYRTRLASVDPRLRRINDFK